MEAACYDIAYATVRGVQSHVSEACRAAAPAQMGIYWGIIGFGIAIVILGAILRPNANRARVAATARPAASTARNWLVSLPSATKGSSRRGNSKHRSSDSSAANGALGASPPQALPAIGVLETPESRGGKAPLDGHFGDLSCESTADFLP